MKSIFEYTCCYAVGGANSSNRLTSLRGRNMKVNTCSLATKIRFNLKKNHYQFHENMFLFVEYINERKGFLGSLLYKF